MTQMTDAAPMTERQTWMGLMARVDPARLADLLPDPLADHGLLRPAEVGAVMVRGRVGSSGAPFNLGEMTVTRCSVRLTTGEVGHAYVQGRDKKHARRAAVLDALMQTAQAADLRVRVLAPLTAEESDRRRMRAEKSAATKVDFFTLVRGED